MALISVDKALLKAKSHILKGEVEEAQKLYKLVLQAFPKNKRAQRGLTVLAKLKQSAATLGPPQGTINQLLNIYNQGQLVKAVEQAQALALQYPEAFIVWNILGAASNALGKTVEASRAFKKVTLLNPTDANGFSNLGVALNEQGKQEEAIEAYNKALALKPNNTDAYYNMGIALKGQGKLKEATESYKKAIALKPDYDEAYNNMGIALKDQGRLDEAIEAYANAIVLKPNYAQAYYNMAIALQEQGRLKEAVESYSKALAIKPNNAKIKQNLAETLKNYSPKGNYRNPIIDLDAKIKAKHIRHTLPKTDPELAIFVSNLLNELESTDKNLGTANLQIYRRNKVDLNCKRHMKIFKEKEIISEFCFGCYKVQVDVTTVLDLIRLAALFYQIEFESDLTRKCLVEVRPNVPGTYKGLVYCRGIEQARSVKTQLDIKIQQIDKNLVARIKKGCSEFPLAFPEYGRVAANEREMMQYPKEWSATEKEFDLENPILPKNFRNLSLREFCLVDYLIMRKWIDYAKGINDPTSKLFCSLPIKYGEIWELAKARLKQ